MVMWTAKRAEIGRLTLRNVIYFFENKTRGTYIASNSADS